LVGGKKPSSRSKTRGHQLREKKGEARLNRGKETCALSTGKRIQPSQQKSACEKKKKIPPTSGKREEKSPLFLRKKRPRPTPIGSPPGGGGEKEKNSVSIFCSGKPDLEREGEAAKYSGVNRRKKRCRRLLGVAKILPPKKSCVSRPAPRPSLTWREGTLLRETECLRPGPTFLGGKKKRRKWVENCVGRGTGKRGRP